MELSDNVNVVSKRMGSLDVESLFTNASVLETIDYLSHDVKNAYGICIRQIMFE